MAKDWVVAKNIFILLSWWDIVHYQWIVFRHVTDSVGLAITYCLKSYLSFLQVLNAKYLRIKERHLFLQYLDKAQYDPAKPNYICLDKLVSLPDEAFCTEVASATLKDFELFQKTM